MSARLTVERLGHLGDGVAEGPVYVTGALPGEVVEGTVDGERMRDPAILSHAPERRVPGCPHYADCGGCALMHASDGFVSRWKADVVVRALAAHGIDAEIAGIATSPPQSRRRAVLSGRRTRAGATVGFHARASAEIAGIAQCRVLRPEIVSALPALCDLVAAGGSRKGEVSLAVTQTETGLDVAVTGARPAQGDLALRLTAIGAEAGFARLTWDGETILHDRAPRVSFAGIAVEPPPGAFLQATAQGEAALIASVAKAVGSAVRVADLFAGCGTFALPLSRRAEVRAVEGEGALLSAAERAWRRAVAHRRLTTEVRDLFRRPLTAAELDGIDAVVIDPPRAGAEAQSREVASARVPRVAMVSCNPVTFARDARILRDGGFGIDWIRVVDQFRWSPHIEIVASMSRRPIDARKETVNSAP